MQENLLLKQVFENFFQGDPWLDVTIYGTLKNVSAEQAARRISRLPNTIWEIVNHMIQWRMNLVQRVQGLVLQTPEDNYFEPVIDTSKDAWHLTIQKLEESHTRWRSFLETVKPEDFFKTYGTTKHSYYELILGIMQHDAYHLGQIILMVKHL